jgi:hypothetical protein
MYQRVVWALPRQTNVYSRRPAELRRLRVRHRPIFLSFNAPNISLTHALQRYEIALYSNRHSAAMQIIRKGDQYTRNRCASIKARIYRQTNVSQTAYRQSSVDTIAKHRVAGFIPPELYRCSSLYPIHFLSVYISRKFNIFVSLSTEYFLEPSHFLRLFQHV